MNSQQLSEELKLSGGFISITRMMNGGYPPINAKGCALALLNRVMSGEELLLGADNIPCHGAATGFGFNDGLPQTPGGFGYFISTGRGAGYPPGERVKCSPQVGEQMLLNQPQAVMDGYDCIRLKPHAETDQADLVTALVSMDQLATLVHLYCFRRVDYDSVIAPMVSGCASVFRVPFGELRREAPRAVIGNIDIFSRPHFPAGSAFFTMPGAAFAELLADADDSVLAAPIWRGIKGRL